MQKPKRPKAISYAVIPEPSDVGRPMYQLLDALIEAHHAELHGARLVLAWCTSWKPDVDGRVTLGKCRKASDLDRELAPYDFVILLSQSFWHHPTTTDRARRALLDHELCHASVKYDEAGEPVIDARGRTVYRVRKHDVEEFSCIVERYGHYKRDVEEFYRAATRGQYGVDHWVGYTAVREQLKRAGLIVPVDAIVAWTDTERREAARWAQLRIEVRRTQNASLWTEEAMPAFLAEASHIQSSSAGVSAADV